MLATIATTRTVIAVSRGHLVASRRRAQRAPSRAVGVARRVFWSSSRRRPCVSAPRSLGSRGASARSVYNTKAECLSVSKVSPKFARRHGFNTNSCGDSLGRTAMHSTYRPGKKRPMSTRSMWKRNRSTSRLPSRPCHRNRERATIRSWPLPRRRLIARRLARSVV